MESQDEIITIVSRTNATPPVRGLKVMASENDQLEELRALQDETQLREIATELLPRHSVRGFNEGNHWGLSLSPNDDNNVGCLHPQCQGDVHIHNGCVLMVMYVM